MAFRLPFLTFLIVVGVLNLGFVHCESRNASNFISSPAVHPIAGTLEKSRCEITIEKPKVLSKGIGSTIVVVVSEEDTINDVVPDIKYENNTLTMIISPGYVRRFSSEVVSNHLGRGSYEVCVGSCGCHSFDMFTIPAPLTLLPPLLTVVLAVLTRQVLVSLTCGVYTAAFISAAYNPLEAFFLTFNEYLVAPFGDPSRAAVLLFVSLMAGLVEITEKSGGAAGLANQIFKLAKTAHHASFVTVLLQMMFFFDDFAGIMISSKSLGPLVHQLGLSVQKFSFIVHTMAVTAASLVPLSSWAGIQIGYIESAFKLADKEVSGFSYLLKTIPYRFFVLSVVMCIFLYVFINKDLPPAIAYEEEANKNRRQRTVSVASIAENYNMEQDTTNAEESRVPLRWFNAVIPLLILITVTLVRMYFDGKNIILSRELDIPITFVNCVSNSNSINDLNVGTAVSLLFVLIAIPLQRILSLPKCLEHFVEGAKSASEPIMILILAWALGIAMCEIHTSDYIALALGNNMPAKYLPAVVTVIGYIMSYSSGSSLGTQGIVFPLIIPVVINLTNDETIYIRTIAAALASSVFGNLCSPIADTTIGSVLFTGCPLIDHIKVATTFAAPIAILTLIFGDLMVGIYPFYVTYIIVAVLFISVLLIFGREPGKKSVFNRLYEVIQGQRQPKKYFGINAEDDDNDIDALPTEESTLLPKSLKVYKANE